MSKTLKPLRGYILLKTIKEEETPTTWVDPEQGKERQAKGQVLALGEAPYLPNGQQTKWEIEIGDVVWFKRFGGEEIKEKGEKYLLVPNGELLGVYK